ncbi:hypothetical protein SAMN05444170_5030 [Bradyrhizobium erythrophlei]|jgi:hypothetical protein|uniref:Uncharacterized protein n=1 Tax=Bradyrhizobium erythrophlei TaxID=1437360 RepID=A0A1M7UGY3_9BRAD|nr:hypothetical protein SAMN05444170_5030 [Bradyrhizobium erythrophlei]
MPVFWPEWAAKSSNRMDLGRGRNKMKRAGLSRHKLANLTTRPIK